jgi:hypothetical protein
MRKFTQLMLTLALLFVGVEGVKAINHYIVYNNGTAGDNDCLSLKYVDSCPAS